MANTLYPTNIGFLPTGVNGTVGVSSVFIGRATSGSFEGVGFGAGGRPDYAQTVQINLTQRAGDGTLTQKGSITLNVADIIAAKTANSNLPDNLNLTLREVAVCDGGVNKRMLIVASAPYAAPA